MALSQTPLKNQFPSNCWFPLSTAMTRPVGEQSTRQIQPGLFEQSLMPGICLWSLFQWLFYLLITINKVMIWQVAGKTLPFVISRCSHVNGDGSRGMWSGAESRNCFVLAVTALMLRHQTRVRLNQCSTERDEFMKMSLKLEVASFLTHFPLGPSQVILSQERHWVV